MSIVIDCDSHVLEPADLWETYLEPEFRDRAIRIERRDGVEHLVIGGQSVLAGRTRGARRRAPRPRRTVCRRPLVRRRLRTRELRSARACNVVGQLGRRSRRVVSDDRHPAVSHRRSAARECVLPRVQPLAARIFRDRADARRPDCAVELARRRRRRARTEALHRRRIPRRLRAARDHRWQATERPAFRSAVASVRGGGNSWLPARDRAHARRRDPVSALARDQTGSDLFVRAWRDGTTDPGTWRRWSSTCSSNGFRN